ncbi:branched-chain amino acid aminotransferase [Trichodelitschia bisporula]|uniref:Branched-chain amino acid aminotransferase n=1 Tax=Trichodelitschia bisporula TaxID=703511 RepID=A0A6G1HTL1_9PEZI|nr:branched-chain amino acid aminotransferase [Trichodelitschia bisporula]
MSPSAVPVSASSLAANDTARTITKTAASITNLQPADALPELNAANLETNFTDAPRSLPHRGSPEEASQSVCTDHMVTCQWTAQTGWQAPKLHAYGPLQLMPTASVLHYATECFEGMKLYRGFDGKLRLFRPKLNTARMLMSATRIALPAFNPEELLKLIVTLCATDGPKWLPKERPGSFLYIRPTMIANDPALGVQKPKQALLYVILCCFPEMDAKPAGMKLLASKEDMVRAWPGGFGFAKVGANYGPTLVCQGEARARGYDQILWLYGKEGQVTEAGASNFFVVWRTPEGKTQLVTAPLSNGGGQLILDGVTRRSVVELVSTRLHDELEIVERKYDIGEVMKAADEGRLLEAFAAGTAFFIAGVGEIAWKERVLKLKVGDDGCGKYAGQVKAWMREIMYGKEDNAWGYVVNETGVPRS